MQSALVVRDALVVVRVSPAAAASAVPVAVRAALGAEVSAVPVVAVLAVRVAPVDLL